MTGYRVYYSGDGVVGFVHRSASTTTAHIQDLTNDGHTYTISVEARSHQISGESNTMNVPLCELSTIFMWQ